ncbi:MAG TPA: CbtA family protein [Casimicrobiaceae bacterium]|nr:CbtA family protein [Casimicrobiaceae bacterium]
MLFRRVVLWALLIGLVSGAGVSLLQHWLTIPIILAAEVFEQKAEVPQPGASAGVETPAHDDSADTPRAAAIHEHEVEAWSPADGVERTGFTVLANALTAMGFALVLLAAMGAALHFGFASKLDWNYGLLWGVAGYAVFFVAPALGLPPEIPGGIVAPLVARQLWWVLTAACAAIALAGASFGKSPWRWMALALLAVPYLIGAPALPPHPFAEHSAADAAALEHLSQRFVWATALTNVCLWLMLGSASGWVARRYLKMVIAEPEGGGQAAARM